MRRTKAQAEETREGLLRAALTVFVRRGVSRASLQEIAQTAGVTRGALYWHFKNKEDLFDALFQRICNDISQRLEDDTRNDAPHMLQSLRQAILNLLDRLVHDELHRQFGHILHLKCEHTEDNAAVIQVMERYHQLWREQTHAALRLCVRQGALPPDLDITAAALFLKASIFGLMHEWLLAPERLNLPQTAPRLVDAALHSLQHAPTLRAPA